LPFTQNLFFSRSNQTVKERYFDWKGVIRMKQFKPLKPILLLLVLCAGLFAGCGRGGGGGDGAASPNPAEGSTWDQMEWDKGKWG
jgi:hypothetical protein